MYALISDETVSAERAAERLLRIKALFVEAALPLYDIDLGLSKPFTNSETKQKGARIDVSAFLYSEIYKNGLAERGERGNGRRGKMRRAERLLFPRDADAFSGVVLLTARCYNGKKIARRLTAKRAGGFYVFRCFTGGMDNSRNRAYRGDRGDVWARAAAQKDQG